MKKEFFILTFFLCFGFFTMGEDRGPIDLVLLLDTSSSMSDFYQGTGDYLSGPFLKEFLNLGDTFHLISFSDKPRLEIVRRIEGRGDLETVIGRLLLMYPLDPYSDIQAALSYAENYVLSIPGGRPKKLVLISDGESSSQSGGTNLDDAGVRNLIAGTSERFDRRGIEMRFVKVPVPAVASAGRDGSQAPRQNPPVGGAASQGTASPGPASQGAVSPGTASPGPVSQGAVSPGTVSQGTVSPGTASQGTASSEPVSSETPPDQESSEVSFSPSEEKGPVSPDGDGTVVSSGALSSESGSSAVQPREEAGLSGGQEPVSPGSASRQSSSVSSAQTSRPRDGGQTAVSGFSPFFILGLGILAFLILALIVFFVSRRLHDSPNRALAHAAGQGEGPKVKTEDVSRNAELLAGYAANRRRTTPIPVSSQAPRKTMQDNPDTQVYTGSLMLSLFVEDQNTAIGRRNIHAVKPGYSFTVGGGKSDFLIFLVPVPPHLADIRFDGRQCTFIPRKPQYFPDIGSQQVPNCVGKMIRIISDKNYELHIRLERYEDPLEALNRLLRSVRLPGDL
jgi:hypothetical protein